MPELPSYKAITAFLLPLLLVGCGGGGSGSSGGTELPLTVIVPALTPQYTYTVQSDIVYTQAEINGGGTFVNLELDLYIPDELTEAERKQFPLLLMIHGGAFRFGSKTNAEILQVAGEYASRGWLVASINYRLFGDEPVPSSRMQPLLDAIGGAAAEPLEVAVVAGIDDVISALEFLQARDDVYVPWTATWGFSAGAYLALLSGYSLDDYGIEPLEVAAVIDYAGSIDGRYRSGTPFDFPTGRDPVLQIIHGTEDNVVPYEEAEILRVLAEDAGLPLDFQAVAGAGHVINLLATNGSTGVSLFQRTVDFLAETIFADQMPGPLVIQ